MAQVNADPHAHHHHDGGPTNSNINLSPHQHAFFLVGKKQLFLVHMGNMGMVPHRYQVVLKVEVDSKSRELMDVERAKDPKAWFVIGNRNDDLFPVPSLAVGDKRSFKGSFWKKLPDPPWSNEHWPWDDAKPLVPDFEVKITSVVYYRPVDFNQEYPRTASYLLFGEGEEAHLHHIVTKRPDYEHVVTLPRAPDWLPALSLRAGVLVNFPHVPARPFGKEASAYTEDPLVNADGMIQIGGDKEHLPFEHGQTIYFDQQPLNSLDQ